MFYEKALINIITLSHCLNTCTELCKKRLIYLSKGCTIKLEFICHSFVLTGGGGGGGGGYILYFVVSFVNRFALHSKFNFSFSGI